MCVKEVVKEEYVRSLINQLFILYFTKRKSILSYLRNNFENMTIHSLCILIRFKK